MRCSVDFILTYYSVSAYRLRDNRTNLQSRLYSWCFLAYARRCRRAVKRYNARIYYAQQAGCMARWSARLWPTNNARSGWVFYCSGAAGLACAGRRGVYKQTRVFWARTGAPVATNAHAMADSAVSTAQPKLCWDFFRSIPDQQHDTLTYGPNNIWFAFERTI